MAHRSTWKLGDTVSFLEGEEREAFLDLAKQMLVWHPNIRILGRAARAYAEGNRVSKTTSS
jgi:hypothetical protein